MSSESVKKAVKEYNAKNCVVFKLAMSRKYDEDVIRQLEAVPSKAGYIKRLIREAMSGQK